MFTKHESITRHEWETNLNIIHTTYNKDQL